jgi:DNA-binding GntR family transcriptional regulator
MRNASDVTSEAASAIAIHRKQSLGTIVRNEIERMILSGELNAGARINEQSLALRLGVSRGPLREAVRALEGAGLLTATPNQGVCVRQVSPEEAIELYDVRAVVFGLLVLRLAARLTLAQEQHLRTLVAKMTDVIDSGNIDEYYALNLQFHDAIAQFAEHQRGKSTYESVIKELHLFRQSGLRSADGMRLSNVEHAAIVDALAAHDGEKARTLAEQHVHKAKRRWIEALGSL